MSEADSTAVPRRFSLMTPKDWFRLPLEPAEAREASIRALVDRTFPSKDQHAENRQELRELFRNIAEDGAARGGVELHISTQAAAGVPLPASLLVSVVPPEDDDKRLHAHWLAELLRDRTPDAEVGVVRLADGEAVRRRRESQHKESVNLGVPPDRPQTSLEFYVPVPNSVAYLLFHFSTPIPELADAMVEMFDAVMGSLTWTYA